MSGTFPPTLRAVLTEHEEHFDEGMESGGPQGAQKKGEVVGT